MFFQVRLKPNAPCALGSVFPTMDICEASQVVVTEPSRRSRSSLPVVGSIPNDFMAKIEVNDPPSSYLGITREYLGSFISRLILLRYSASL